MGWYAAAIFEDDPGVVETRLGGQHADVVFRAGVAGVGVAEDDDGVARGPSGDVVSYLLDVGAAGGFVAGEGAGGGLEFDFHGFLL